MDPEIFKNHEDFTNLLTKFAPFSHDFIPYSDCYILIDEIISKDRCLK